MALSDFDCGDIQGLVRSAFPRLTDARFYLLRIANADAARTWLGARLPLGPATEAASRAETASEPLRITTATKGTRPDRALQVAFTADGLRQMGVAGEIVRAFSSEFLGGMVEEGRSRRLGDIGDNAPDAPDGWKWGRPDKPERMPHLIVLLYTGKDKLPHWEARLHDDLWRAAFSHVDCLDTNDIGGKEPFGFKDGLSQPCIDWDRRHDRLRDTQDYTNLSAPGEFLLGYENEYRLYTDRPLLFPRQDPEGLLPPAEDTPGKRDFGRNGSYLVVRDLAQDVVGFWQFADREAQHHAGGRQALAEAMVGRTMEGDALVPLRAKPIPGVVENVDKNQFTFENDVDGASCPLGAHIRRANPRNADLPAGVTNLISQFIRTIGFGGNDGRDDLIASVRFHRILRRGREYGPELTPEQAVQGEDERHERGIRFICLNANISRQFEFVQSAWIANTKFAALDEGDPLLGNRRPPWPGMPPTDRFARPQTNGLNCRVSGLPQFVRVRGGAYFFLPGISALRYIARNPTSPV